MREPKWNRLAFSCRTDAKRNGIFDATKGSVEAVFAGDNPVPEGEDMLWKS
jgi:hypothetical protein